jgi:hypothetical protein
MGAGLTEMSVANSHARLTEALALTNEAIALVDGISITAHLRLGEAAAVLRLLTDK